MKLILKNSSIEMLYHPLTWSTKTFNEEERLDTYINSQIDAWFNNGYCYIFSVGTIKKIRITANDSNNTVIAFLTTNSHEYRIRPDYCDNTDFIKITNGTTMEFTLPSDCNYIYIMSSGVASNPAKNLPSRVEIGEFV